MPNPCSTTSDFTISALHTYQGLTMMPAGMQIRWARLAFDKFGSISGIEDHYLERPGESLLDIGMLLEYIETLRDHDARVDDAGDIIA